MTTASQMQATMVAQQKKAAVDFKISAENLKYAKITQSYNGKLASLKTSYDKSTASHNTKLTKLNADKAKIVG